MIVGCLLGAACDAALAAGEELRAASFNIKHAELTGGDLGPFARELGRWRPDVVALQEVDRSWRRSASRDQAAELGAALGMRSRFFPTLDCAADDEDRDGDCGYGIAILSRWPILAGSARTYRLPVLAGQEPRVLARLAISKRGKRVEIFNTHLTHWPTHRVQIKTIISRLPRDDRPVLLMGDLTSGPTAVDVGWLRRRLVDAQGAVGSQAPTIAGQRLDYVFASRSLRIVGAGAPAWTLSDHRPVLARVRLPG